MNHLNELPPSRVLAKLRRGEPAFSAKACYADPELVEAIASSGVDAVWLCQEHRRLDPSLFCSLIQACRLGGADALVRVKPADHTDLAWLLEAGARGILLPKVTTVEEVRRVVEMMRYPPLGRRGWDAIHADSAFGRLPAEAYLAHANANTFLAVQIEEPEAVEQVEEIAALPGVDLLFVGPADLTLNLGSLGSRELLEPVLERVVRACRAHGKAAAIPCLPQEAAGYVERGFTFLNVASDFRCVATGLQSALTAAGVVRETPPR